MQLLDGKALAARLRGEIRDSVQQLTADGQRPPHLVAILVGEDPASQSYVNFKMRDCQEIGYRSTLIPLGTDVTQQALLEQIAKLNDDPEVDGMIVQLPLPEHIDATEVLFAIDPAKDVDGFHPFNVGKMTLGLDTLLPATPAGIVEMLRQYEIPTSGKRCVVLGRSNIVGRPLSVLLSGKGAAGNSTVTVCHSRTPQTDIEKYCREADILISALGAPGFVPGEWVKEGAVVIDVGTTRVPDASRKRGYRLAGDVRFETAKTRAAYLTPVPGGVGPMTRLMLLKNTLKAYRMRGE